MPGRVARHHVREEIQRRILSGETRAGERLSQQSLARELGVAQGTVRESLFELQWLGLVESVDHLGVFVGDLDVSRILQAYQVREFLEGLAARLCCSSVGRSDIAVLRAMAEDVYRLAKKNNEEEMGRLDRKFHFHITELSRNRILLRLAETYRVLGMTVRASREPRLIHDEHLAIVEAIEKNRPDEAEKLARRHVAAAAQMIESQASQGKFVPKWVE
ncbi:MAG TPA: GntR family transcriptional regulator [Acidobacteriaceae bacterium]|nr:GntR family transcriptional regulator [Acidobacteriaceae bacterium]